MAHFAEIDGNNVVVRVLVVPDEQEHRGQDFLANDLGLGGTWIQTSYNTRGGVHYRPNSGVPSGRVEGGARGRRNFAVRGAIYNSVLDLFVQPKPYPSWLLNEETGGWDPPKDRPMTADLREWKWDESALDWVRIEVQDTEEIIHG